MYSFYTCIIYQCAGFTILQCTFQFYAQFYSHDDNKSPEIIHFLSNISRTLKKQVMVIPEKIQFCQKMMILLMGMNLTWRKSSSMSSTMTMTTPFNVKIETNAKKNKTTASDETKDVDLKARRRLQKATDSVVQCLQSKLLSHEARLANLYIQFRQKVTTRESK